MDRPLVAVVMAGGTGTRLYPASRSDRPKQFLPFGGDRSLLSRTVDRVDFADELVVSTRPGFADEIGGHAPDAEVLVEPEPKDTGPALVYAAHRFRDDDPVMLCLPSDHHVEGDFEATARRAARAAAETEGLVTIGIEPDRPATEFGYIDPGAEHGDYAEVASFREKPDAETAVRFVREGRLWNAGMFAWTASALLREARASPLAPFVEGLDADPDEAFATVDPASVDHAVMEHTEDAYVVPAGFAWDDLGSWDAVARVVDGLLADSIEIDAPGTLVAGDHHVTAIGVPDLVIAAYGDRVLVVPKDEAQRVREAVAALEERGLY